MATVLLRACQSNSCTKTLLPPHTGLNGAVLMHNHSSGDPTSSQANIQMTKAIIETAKLLSHAVPDHIDILKDLGDGTYDVRIRRRPPD